MRSSLESFFRNLEMKNIKRKLILFFSPSLIFFLIKLLYKTCKVEYQIDPKTLELLQKQQNFIVAFWHGNLLMQPCLFKKVLKNSPQKAYVLISQHFDGDIISRAIKLFGIDSLRGSSSKGNIKVLLLALRKLQENDFIVITPDGPRGPYHSIADGIVLLSQKSKRPIVSSQIHYQKFWEFKSWDRFQIPKPFSRITHILKEPLWIENLDLDKAKAKIRHIMET